MTYERAARNVWALGLRIAVSLALLLTLSIACKKKEPSPAGESAPEAKAPAVPEATKAKAGPTLPAQVALRIGSSSGMRDPRGIAVDRGGNLYVVDTGNNRVLKFDSSGKVLSSFGSKGSGPGQFHQAWACAVTPHGNIAVLDADTTWVEVFSPAGRLVGRLGGPGIAFYHPAGLAVAPDETVWVVDTGGNRIVPINPAGKAGTPLLAAGKEPFSQPTDIYVDARGGLHVYQTAGAKTPSVFYHLTPTGEFEGKWIAPEAPSTLDTPRAALAGDGRVFVTDPRNQQIRAYDSDGAAYHLLQFEGADAPVFRNLTGIAVDAQGRVYAADAAANIVYRLQVSAPK